MPCHDIQLRSGSLYHAGASAALQHLRPRSTDLSASWPASRGPHPPTLRTEAGLAAAAHRLIGGQSPSAACAGDARRYGAPAPASPRRIAARSLVSTALFDAAE